MSKSKDKLNYSKQYPEIEKWLNHCVICGTVGYKPELPEKIYPGQMSENIRSLFSMLAVDELSMCEQCSKHFEK